MKGTMNRRFSTLLIILLLLLLFVLAFQFAAHEKYSEMLIVWGRQTQPGPCLIWLIDPKNESTTSSTVGYDNCNYRIVDIAGKPTFVHIQHFPGEITTYAINRNGQLVQHQIIKSENTGIDILVSGANGVVYFNTTVDGHEQIFRLDKNTTVAEPFITNPTGMASGPNISPDKNYLVYWTLEGVASNNCLHCNFGQYRLYNLENKTDLALSDLVYEQIQFAQYPHDFLHCRLQWSPDSRFIAFNIGACDLWGPSSLAIVDVKLGKVVEILPPLLDGYSPKNPFVFGWLSETDLIYSQPVYFGASENNNFLTRYFIYSTETGVSEELAEFLPIKNPDGSLFELIKIDWTSDGNYLIGVIFTTLDTNNLGLLLTRVNRQTKTMTVLESENSYNIDPILSPSGNWFAYYSAPDRETANEQGVELRISPLIGDSQNTGATNLIELFVHYGWIER